MGCGSSIDKSDMSDEDKKSVGSIEEFANKIAPIYKKFSDGDAVSEDEYKSVVTNVEAILKLWKTLSYDAKKKSMTDEVLETMTNYLSISANIADESGNMVQHTVAEETLDGTNLALELPFELIKAELGLYKMVDLGVGEMLKGFHGMLSSLDNDAMPAPTSHPAKGLIASLSDISQKNCQAYQADAASGGDAKTTDLYPQIMSAIGEAMWDYMSHAVGKVLKVNADRTKFEEMFAKMKPTIDFGNIVCSDWENSLTVGFNAMCPDTVVDSTDAPVSDAFCAMYTADGADEVKDVMDNLDPQKIMDALVFSV